MELMLLLALSLALVAFVVQRVGRTERMPVRLYIPSQRLLRRRRR